MRFSPRTLIPILGVSVMTIICCITWIWTPPPRTNYADEEAKPAATTNNNSSIHILLIADAKFQASYNLQIETVRCFSEAKGLNMIIPSKEDMEACDVDWNQKFNGNFFFKRHCILAKIMQNYPADDYFVSLDADVMAFDFKRDFPQEYLRHDLVFYERYWNGELAVPFGARNKESVREWLMTWSREYQQSYVPKNSQNVFFSSDNGIIHVLIMKWFILHRRAWLEREGHWTHPQQRQALSCIQSFASLNETVNNLKPYFEFVRCARIAMGMQSNVSGNFLAYEEPVNDPTLTKFREKGIEFQSFDVKLKILPRFHGIVLDYTKKQSATENVLFFHGVKKKAPVLDVWKSISNMSVYPLCQLNVK